LKIFVELGGILTWLEFKELEFGWLGRTTIRFCSSYVMWFQVCKCVSYSNVVEIFVRVKDLGVSIVQKCDLGVIFVKLSVIVKTKLKLSW